MIKVRKVLLAGVLSLSLASCGTVQSIRNAYDAVSSATVSPKMVIVAGNTFDGIEATATNYLRRARCTGFNGPLCRDPAATKRLVPAIRAGRVARANLEQFLKDHPGQLGPRGLYDAYVNSVATLQGVMNQYRITP